MYVQGILDFSCNWMSYLQHFKDIIHHNYEEIVFSQRIPVHVSNVINCIWVPLLYSNVM